VTAEEAKLHHLRGVGIHRRELGERLVHREDVGARPVSLGELVHFEVDDIRTTLARALAPCVIDQHALRLDPKIAAGPVTLALADLCTILIYFALASALLR